VLNGVQTITENLKHHSERPCLLFLYACWIGIGHRYTYQCKNIGIVGNNRFITNCIKNCLSPQIKNRIHAPEYYGA